PPDWPVRPPATKPENQNALGGLTATMAGQTASYLTAAQTFRKRVFSQTNNAIANCHIILRSCAYPHDIHNLPLDEHIGNYPENEFKGLSMKILAVFA
ncbi:hypothetical protein JGD54_25365, partial [Salmonella enterica subsp. enterica serovar Typhimurium]|nr:hypothetical protein [Salmonella enterica subsp. enterica serovar Typhimurium]